jgi:hypothetical protein
MPSAPESTPRPASSAPPAARTELALEAEGPDAAIAPIILGTATALAVPPAAQNSPPPAAVATPVMDRDFIARNQIVERYISGRLPIKGATEFERFCAEHPEMLDELGLPERVNAGLRLLEAAGKPEPWQEEPKKLWEKPQVVWGLAAAVGTLVIALGIVWSSSSGKTSQINSLKRRVTEQPLEAATSTRTIRLEPSYKGASNTPAVVIGSAGETQLADLKFDLSRSQYRGFRMTIDRIDQGRVAILNNLLKDSNGHVRLSLNSSALGPGNYQFTIEGLTWKGDPVPEAWITIGVTR